MAATSDHRRTPVGTLAIGSKLNRYEVLARLASGGMATVYVARMQGVAGFERLVAIKVLHSNLAHEAEFIDMFLDEARLAASIRHPNVVPTLEISDSKEAGHGYFLVMEYIEGDHLGALLSTAHKAGEKLPVPVALRMIADALAGLGAAHGLCDDTGRLLHLVHRDVSPHNIMIGRDGVVRLTDFGVAKAEDRLTHTRDGQVKGKLAYMAPEQASGVATDARSDLFSMAIILWECLAGQRLFRADTTAATLNKLLHGAIPSLSSIDASLAPFDALLARALEREPSQRFQTAEAFASAIEDLAQRVCGLGSMRAVARTVKQYAAAKLEREKRLVDEALRALRPADRAQAELTLDEEITNPSTTDVSLTGASLSASKVSGVFSHHTTPDARRTGGFRTIVTSTSASVITPPNARMRAASSPELVAISDEHARMKRSWRRAQPLLIALAAAIVAITSFQLASLHTSASLEPARVPERPEPALAIENALANETVDEDPPAPTRSAAVPRRGSESVGAANTGVRPERGYTSRGNARRVRKTTNGSNARPSPNEPSPATDVMPNPYHN
ncbi:MAG: hypothetical protein RL701_927 [Pseudomonadota bacterium]